MKSSLLRARVTHLALFVMLGAISLVVAAQDLNDLAVGTIRNFGPDLQTIAGGVCRLPEGIALDSEGNLYLASNSDQAITVGARLRAGFARKFERHHRYSRGPGSDRDPARR